ncbi:hypothetical protein B0H63DRAFT_85335 [Podospora didyma]|uniref:Peptidase S8/S53 domain-containing protein n=1 Tax=Podospora didyma TaxID=330526 RepID=A0AAE0N2D7_9PEZI|nr:hypothetical protein B0H63DRAFT_85335 [Podospora didyma]
MARSMARPETWVEVDPRDWGIDNILQVGQVLTVPDDPQTALLKIRGPFNGFELLEQYAIARKPVPYYDCQVRVYCQSISLESILGAGYLTSRSPILFNMKPGGDGVPFVAVQSIHPGADLLRCLMQREEEIYSYLNTKFDHRRTNLYLVTKIRKLLHGQLDRVGGDISTTISLGISAGSVPGTISWGESHGEAGGIIGFVVEQLRCLDVERWETFQYYIDPTPTQTKSKLHGFKALVQRTLGKDVMANNETIPLRQEDTFDDWEMFQRVLQQYRRIRNHEQEQKTAVLSANQSVPTIVAGADTSSDVSPVASSPKSGSSKPLHYTPSGSYLMPNESPKSLSRSHSVSRTSFSSDIRSQMGRLSIDTLNPRGSSQQLSGSSQAPQDQDVQPYRTTAGPTTIASVFGAPEQSGHILPTSTHTEVSRLPAVDVHPSPSQYQRQDSEMTAASEESQEIEERDTRRAEIVFDSASTMASDPQDRASADGANSWFASKDGLGINGVNRFFKSQANRRTFTNIESVPHANVAIIDTGIDLRHPDLKRYIATNQINGAHCRDFVTGESPISDSTGHGTHCAHLLLKVCPTAKLYISKVFETDRGDEGAAERIPQAIEWAMDIGVDIIVMAFAFSDTQDGIRKAIVNAKATRDVLFFAAASNNRHNERNPVGFPARMSEAIRVNSCTWQGHPSKFSPPGFTERDNLATLGEELYAAFTELNYDNSRPSYRKRLSGTSGSTALMAGIAGLVLEFARTTSTRGSNVENAERLLRNEGMMAILQHCMVGGYTLPPDRYRNIKPWVLFHPQAPREVAVFQITQQLKDCM